jgi:ubiquinone/menaquinone biosynthesis C-methylase UbiE
MFPKKLNLGCGYDIRNGYINLDRFDFPGVDIVYDLEKLPLPFDDEEVVEIICRDILEHLEYIQIMKEFYRILAFGGKLKIRVPHFTSANNYIDPTHKKLFSIQTFDYFIKTPNYNFVRNSYYYFSRISYSKITFFKKSLFYNYPVEAIVNLSPKIQRFYEITMLSRIFPAENIVIELTK